jgi:hypothetical protein
MQTIRMIVKFRIFFMKVSGWLSKKPRTKATWIMVLISCVMMGTLIQNHEVIKQNAQVLKNAVQSLELQKLATSNVLHQIQIEEETRLNPDLECAYNPHSNHFVVRNAGTAPATTIYLAKTIVACVQSNQVLDFADFRKDGPGIQFPSLVGKQILQPGEQADAAQVYVPDGDRLTEFWRRTGDYLLVRVYIEYERPAPAYRRYSGYFNFLFEPVAQRLVTAEENPSIREIVARYNSMPRAQHHPVLYRGGQWDIWSNWTLGTDNGGVVAGTIGSGSNAVPVLRGGWTKHD